MWYSELRAEYSVIGRLLPRAVKGRRRRIMFQLGKLPRRLAERDVFSHLTVLGCAEDKLLTRNTRDRKVPSNSVLLYEILKR